MNKERLGNILESHVNLTDLGKMQKHIFKGVNNAMKQAVNEAIYEFKENFKLQHPYSDEIIDNIDSFADQLKVK